MNSSIIIKPLSIRDADKVYTLFSNRKVVQSYLEPPINDRKDITGFIKRITTDCCWTWKIIEVGEPSSLLGICSLHHLNTANKSIEIGGTLFPEYWGKGIMNKAFKILIKKAYTQFHVDIIVGKTSPTNTKAIRLVKKLGFEITNSIQDEITLIKIL